MERLQLQEGLKRNVGLWKSAKPIRSRLAAMVLVIFIKAHLFTLKKTLGEKSTALKDSHIIEREIGRLERIVRDVLLSARPAEPKRRSAS